MWRESEEDWRQTPLSSIVTECMALVAFVGSAPCRRAAGDPRKAADSVAFICAGKMFADFHHFAAMKHQFTQLTLHFGEDFEPAPASVETFGGSTNPGDVFSWDVTGTFGDAYPAPEVDEANIAGEVATEHGESFDGDIGLGA